MGFLAVKGDAGGMVRSDDRMMLMDFRYLKIV
jgi:hypothetical protein